MSVYINFYVKVKDSYAPIGSFSQNSKIGAFFSRYAQWNKVSPIGSDCLKVIHNECNERIDEFDDNIRDVHQDIEMVLSMNNSVSEKMDMIGAIREEELYYKEDLADYAQLKNWVHFLETILEEAYAESEYGENILNLNPDNYIFVGIETSVTEINR